jgi:hypothetical protein
MIRCDIDGVLIDTIGTAAKFGVELKPNDFSVDIWQYVTPEEFYAKATLQPWANELMEELVLSCNFLTLATSDFAEIKESFLNKALAEYTPKNYGIPVLEAPDKSILCKNPYVDFLIDDNKEQCKKWERVKGSSYSYARAFWWNLENPDIYEDFLKAWRCK